MFKTSLVASNTLLNLNRQIKSENAFKKTLGLGQFAFRLKFWVTSGNKHSQFSPHEWFVTKKIIFLSFSGYKRIDRSISDNLFLFTTNGGHLNQFLMGLMSDILHLFLKFFHGLWSSVALSRNESSLVSTPQTQWEI